VGHSVSKFKGILLRILATFTATALGTLGAGTIAGVEMWKSIFMAGIGGVATVVESLARAYLKDGELSKSDIDAAFNDSDEESPIPRHRRPPKA
jgi:hypothetical protein